MIKDGAKTSAKVTTVQFTTPAAPNLDAASLGTISPEIAKIVKHGSAAAPARIAQSGTVLKARRPHQKKYLYIRIILK